MAMATSSALVAASFTATADSIFDTSSTRSFRGFQLARCNSAPQVPRVFSSRCFRLVRASSPSSTSSASSSSTIPSKSVAGNGKPKVKDVDGDVKMIATQQEFETVLRQAGDKLVVVEYAASHSVKSKKIYPAMVELSRTCPDVVFRLILADESEDTKEIFRQAGVVSVPHFIFYKNMEKVHEEEGITEDVLLGDVLYYGDSSRSIEQLHSRKDVESLMDKHKSDGKLIVLDVGLKHCGPCVKVYPTVIKLAKKMAESTVFARMHGDESDECMALLKEMNVLEVPTFLFIRDGKVMGRYVGSGRGELIGEILKHQGVRVTY